MTIERLTDNLTWPYRQRTVARSCITVGRCRAFDQPDDSYWRTAASRAFLHSSLVLCPLPSHAPFDGSLRLWRNRRLAIASDRIHAGELRHISLGDLLASPDISAVRNQVDAKLHARAGASSGSGDAGASASSVAATGTVIGPSTLMLFLRKASMSVAVFVPMPTMSACPRNEPALATLAVTFPSLNAEVAAVSMLV
jgi:hypothetical protein